MAELHIADKNLCVTPQSVIKKKTICMQQMDLAAGRGPSADSLVNRRDSFKQAKTKKESHTEEI